MITASTNSITYLQCTQCQDGLYLLRNQTQNQEFYPEKFTFCTPDCEKSHYAFINDPLTGTCKDCGKFCRSCNNQFGCELCDAEDAGDQGWVNAYDSTSPYSNFKKCQECSNNKYCLICSSSDPTSCSSCASDYSSSCTSYSFESFLDNCLQGVSGSSSSCQMCKDYFFVNQINSCSSCSPLTNCLECDSSYNCEQCEQGFTLVDSSTVSTRLRRNLEFNDNQILNLDQNSNQSNCNKNAENYEKYFSDCASCTQDSSNQSLTVCNGCKNGFFNDGKCVSKCPSGYYGTQDFTERGLISQSYCSQCHSSCEECIGQSSSECTKCGKNKYLELGSYMISYGTCESKTTSTASFTLYVQAADEPSGSDTQSITGQQISDAFYQLDDAIVKSEELCAHVTQKCTVMIYLLNGDHYLLRNARNTYRPLKQDKSHQVIEMTIQPLFCSINSDALCVTDDTHLTIYNKMRDKFNLKMRMIRIHVYHKGQSAALQMIQQLYLQIADPMGAIIMLDRILLAILILQHFLRSMDCQIAQGTSFIEFDLNEHMVLSSSPTLILDNVEFRNFYYDFNSLIELNSYGGNVEITNSVFQSFSQCGSIIRNYKKILSYDSYSTSSANEVQSYQYRNNLLQNQIYNFIDSEETLTFNPFNQSCSLINSDKNPCFSISIKNTIFKQMYHFEQQQITPIKVNSNYGLVHHGKILNLDNFRGNVIIEDSSFLNNQQNFIDCSIAESIYNKESQSATTIFGTKDKFQMRHLISIQNHNFGIYIMNNNFDQNTVINGLVNILLQESQQGIYPTIIYKNTFTKNAAYYDTVGIQLRIQTSNLFQESISDSTLKCTGITVEENSFTYNFGCPAFTGPTLSVECYDPTVASIDERDKLRMNVQISSALIDEYTYTDYSALTATDIHTYSYNSIDIQVYYKKFILKGNNFIDNQFGNSQGLIELKGIQRIIIENSHFNNNKEGSLDTTNEIDTKKYGSLLPLISAEQDKFQAGSLLIENTEFSDIEFQIALSESAQFYSMILNYKFQIKGDFGIILQISSFDNLPQFNFILDNCQLEYVTAQSYGGFMQITNLKNSQIYIINSLLTQINAKIAGGLIYISDSQYDMIEGILFSNMTQTGTLSNSIGQSIYINQPNSFQLTIQDSVFTCEETLSSDILANSLAYLETNIESQFKAQKGSLFYLNSINDNIQVHSEQNTYQNCYGSYQGSIFHIKSDQSSEFSENSSNYYQNQAVFGGAIYCKNCFTFAFVTPKFISNSAYMGGSIYLESDTIGLLELNLDQFTIETSQSLSDGGFLYFEGSSVQIDLLMKNTDFKDTLSSYLESVEFDDIKVNTVQGGGLVYLIADTVQIEIDSCNFYNLSSLYHGGGVFQVNAISINIDMKYSKFADVQSLSKGSLMSLSGTQIQLNILKSDFKCHSSGDYLTGSYGSAFALEATSQSTISSLNNTYEQCGKASQGGIFQINQYISLTEKYSVYKNLGSILGDIQTSSTGAFIQMEQDTTALASTLTIQNTLFQNMSIYQGGGLIYLNHPKVQVNIDTAQFYNNYMVVMNEYQGCVFQVQQAASIIIDKTTFVKNSSCQYEFFPKYYQVAATLDKNLNFTMKNSYIRFKDNFDSQMLIALMKIDGVTIAYTQKIYEGIFYFVGANVTSINNTFTKNLISTRGGIYFFDQAKFWDYGSTYKKNAALMGAVFLAKNSNIYFYNSVFDQNYAQIAGIGVMIDSCSGVFDNNTFQNAYAAFYGGGFYFIPQSATSVKTTFTFQNSNFNQLTSSALGGVFYVANSAINLVLINCEFTNSQALYLGAVFYLNQVSNFTCDNCRFADNKVGIYGSCSSTFNYEEAVFDSVESNFQIIFRFCNEGGVWLSTDLNLNDYNSVYYNNSGMVAGVSAHLKSNITFHNCTFYHNFAQECGCFQADLETFITFYDCHIHDNWARKIGLINVVTKSWMYMESTLIENNYALDQISTINLFGTSLVTHKLNHIKSFQDFPQVIKNTTFINNYAGQTTLFIMYSTDVLIEDCYFSDNISPSGTRGIFVGYSDLEIKNTVFQDSKMPKTTFTDLSDHQNQQGSYMYILGGADIQISLSSFINGYAYYGGAIFISGQSNVTFDQCIFRQNRAFTGGAIMAQQFTTLILKNKCQLTYNMANSSGDSIYGFQSSQNISIDSSSILNSQATNAIQLQQVKFYSNNLKIQHNTNAKQVIQEGGAISCKDCYIFHLNNSEIKNVNAPLGGAIYLQESSNEKQTTHLYMIVNTLIQNSWAYDSNGGALYLDNINKLILNNTKIVNSIANQYGGGMYYTCPAPFDCTVELDRINYFEQNYAGISGGAIYWQDIEPIYLNKSQLVYKNNLAKIYGPNIGCFAQKIMMINEDTYDQILNSRILQSMQEPLANTSQSNFRSGDYLPQMYLALVDQYGQILQTDSQSKLQITINQRGQPKDQQKQGLYSPIVEGQTIFYAKNGIFKVNGILFTASPGYQYDVIFNTDGIDQNKPSNIKYLQDQASEKAIFNMTVALRECEVGEKFSEKGSCEQCISGTQYSLIKMTSPGSCLTCPTSVALCLGGSHIGPRPGYWRKSNTTQTFIECLNTNACLGMIPPEFNEQGSCLRGYSGILCSTCQIDFSRTGNYECSLCPEEEQNILRLVGVTVFAVVIVIALIRSTLNGALVKKNITSIFQKILMNHIQLILLTQSFNFNWPKAVQQFFTSSQPVADTSSQIISIDCFMNTNLYGNSHDHASIMYTKLVVYVLLPFILFLASFAVWYLISKIKKEKGVLRTKAISTLVILLFLVHPSLVSNYLKIFNCVDIDGESRNKDNLEIECNSKSHELWKTVVTLPAIIVWGLGIPFFAYLLMFTRRNQLEAIQTRSMFGFLFRGYKKRFYYWEIVIMYRKLIFIFVSAFVVSEGVVTQNLPLNNLEILSLITQAITIFCGLFYILDINATSISTQDSADAESQYQNQQNEDNGVRLSEDTKMLFFVVIVMSNAIFFAYWVLEFFKEMQSKIILKFGKVYLVICLCGNENRYKKVRIQTIIDEENELLRERFMHLIKNTQKLQENGEIILNNNVLERLKLYLDPNKILEAIGNKPQLILKEANKIIFKNKKQKKVLGINRDNRKKNQSLMQKQITNLSSQMNQSSPCTNRKLNKNQNSNTLFQSETESSRSSDSIRVSDDEQTQIDSNLNNPQLEQLDHDEWKQKYQVRRSKMTRIGISSGLGRANEDGRFKFNNSIGSTTFLDQNQPKKSVTGFDLGFQSQLTDKLTNLNTPLQNTKQGQHKFYMSSIPTGKDFRSITQLNEVENEDDSLYVGSEYGSPKQIANSHRRMDSQEQLFKQYSPNVDKHQFRTIDNTTNHQYDSKLPLHKLSQNQALSQKEQRKEERLIQKMIENQKFESLMQNYRDKKMTNMKHENEKIELVKKRKPSTKVKNSVKSKLKKIMHAKIIEQLKLQQEEISKSPKGKGGRMSSLHGRKGEEEKQLEEVNKLRRKSNIYSLQNKNDKIQFGEYSDRFNYQNENLGNSNYQSQISSLFGSHMPPQSSNDRHTLDQSQNHQNQDISPVFNINLINQELMNTEEDIIKPLQDEVQNYQQHQQYIYSNPYIDNDFQQYKQAQYSLQKQQQLSSQSSFFESTFRNLQVSDKNQDINVIRQNQMSQNLNNQTPSAISLKDDSNREFAQIHQKLAFNQDVQDLHSFRKEQTQFKNNNAVNFDQDIVKHKPKFNEESDQEQDWFDEDSLNSYYEEEKDDVYDKQDSGDDHQNEQEYQDYLQNNGINNYQFSNNNNYNIKY
eukprot:403332515